MRGGPFAFLADEEETAPDLAEADARTMLADAFAVWDQVATFAPGDLVRPKRGIRCGPDFRGGVAVYLRDGIGPDSPACFDCTIGIINDDGAMVEAVYATRYLELAGQPASDIPASGE